MVLQTNPTQGAYLALAIALAFSAIQAFGAENQATDMQAPTVEVIGTTPIPGLGTPIEQVPSNVQEVTGKRIDEQQVLNLPDFMNQAMPSVSISEVQNNPYQPTLTYRGFEASPLLGAPQGLSIFQDGVRVNEPFGDVVNWDLIPLPAISTMTLVPGSNPVFGLNTLGGAIEIRTKSGRDYPGLEVEAYGGSWGRLGADFAWGGSSDKLDYFIAGSWFDEDGWRDFSPSNVKQIFAKVGHHTADTTFDFSITAANTDLTGNGVTPESMLQTNYNQIYTYPDNTRNQMTMLNLSGSHWVSDKFQISGLVYYRINKTNTLNGDVNDDFEGSANDGATGANGGAGFDIDTAVSNRTNTKQTGDGLGLQGTWILDKNTLAVGTTYDNSDSDFSQTAQLGNFQTDRSVQETGPVETENELKGTSQTASIYATDTWSITKEFAATVSGRYNYTKVKTTDQLNTVPPNLDGDFTYKSFNPAVGVTYQFSPTFGGYAGWNQGTRAPSPIELGCADPNNPCTLPNALASDPFLEQVTTRTVELGLRGKLSGSMGWNAGVFRSINTNDILFVGTTTSAGYFTNFGKTRRQGAELGLNGRTGKMNWSVNYSYVNATFQSSACLLSENNSSAGSSPACPSPDNNLILVSPGNKIPGIPEQMFKLNADYNVTDKWNVGGMVLAFSQQYARGNENNEHQAGNFNGEDFQGSGTVGGYTILNLMTRYQMASNWQIFGRINNVFDTQYATGGILAENAFDSSGNFLTNSDDWAHETFFAPGAPRAYWIGVKYTMGQNQKK